MKLARKGEEKKKREKHEETLLTQRIFVSVTVILQTTPQIVLVELCLPSDTFTGEVCSEKEQQQKILITQH